MKKDSTKEQKRLNDAEIDRLVHVICARYDDSEQAEALIALLSEVSRDPFNSAHVQDVAIRAVQQAIPWTSAGQNLFSAYFSGSPQKGASHAN